MRKFDMKSFAKSLGALGFICLEVLLGHMKVVSNKAVHDVALCPVWSSRNAVEHDTGQGPCAAKDSGLK